MRRLKVLIAIFLSALTLFTYGQSPLAVGKSQLNAGVGLSGWGVPLYLGLDYSFHKDFTLGGEISFRSYHENWKNYSYSHSITGFSANVNYHFNNALQIPHDWDFYAGLNLGFYVWSSPDAYQGNHSSGLGLGAQIGGRYYFTNKIGLNLELGGGNAFSGGKVGVTIKL